MKLISQKSSPVIFSVYLLQENEAFLAVPRSVMMTTTSAKSSALGRNPKIVNIFLTISFNICFGCSEKTSH